MEGKVFWRRILPNLQNVNPVVKHYSAAIAIVHTVVKEKNAIVV